MINNKISFFYYCKALLIISLLLSMPLQSKKSSLPISVQLWSVKNELKQDFDGTLNALANMGFNGVEFAGEFGNYKENPSALRARLDNLGLVASSAHIGFDALTKDKLESTLLFYKSLGVSLLFVPWDERAWDPKGIKSLNKQLSEVNELAQKYAMSIGFHNHNREFEQFKNATYWDNIASNTPKTMPLQLDIGWVHFANKNPIYYIKKYPGRTLATHLKVRTHEGDNLSPIFGENDYPWQKIIKSLLIDGGVEWLVIEQEEYPQGLTPLQSVAKSKANLDTILATMNQ
ncbi:MULTISPECIES: sugar phosphate isomerase/epimerase [unclassified Pseudoalteromonas]|uniref:sugar phosphate isomerase/epimerase family protein n=1 Tax=unclassified Pseudoalteromonas TaxID=194690 RepID=UPI0025B2D0A2|nr:MULTISPECIES: sugar phosphate isomerase/epimerase [unclassified Pseudoalteromonas]MDN3380248.1 sugar phosphate isomerase/epimerase [Pseudoalteromonas sp. APC 3893]MDN3388638.1 sugar phosphate isomerase/epimerase [Pseudoalteromonas sp. APC 4017]